MGTLKARRSSRVVWTESEKRSLLTRAADIQSERPELAGLPLLREAMNALPAHRRRRLIAVTQAEWFEPGLADEIRKRQYDKINPESLNQEHQKILAFVALIYEKVQTIGQKVDRLQKPSE